MNRKLSLLVAVVMLVGVALAGCTTPAASTSTAPAVENTTPAASASAEATPSAEASADVTAAPAIDETHVVKWLDSQEPPEMNSLLMTDTVCLTLYRHVGEGLVRMGPTNERQPGIAESWDVSDDGLTYTFHLRDAKWSNGDPITANDFAFTFKTLLNKDTGASYSYLGYLIKGGKAYNDGKGKVEDLGIEVKDDKTLVITLERPADYFLDVCAFGVFFPVNEKFYNSVGAANYGKDADKILYSGPFVIETWEHEVGLVLKKNPNYWNASVVKIAGIDMRIVKDSETALNMFLAGDLDMVGVRGKQIETVEAEGFKVSHYGDGATFYIEFNTRDKIGGKANPLANKNIRQALSFALDRKGYVSTVLKNASLPATSYTTPEIAGKTKATFPEEFAEPLVKDNDPAAAKAALEAGLAELNLKVEDLKISMLSDDTDTAKETAAFYQECWKRNLGITVEILTMPFKSRIEKLQNNDFMMSSSGWGPDYNDPMTMLDVWETGNGNNHTGYTSKDFDALLDQARNEKDRDKRYDIYFAMEKMLMTDMPIAPVYFRVRDYTTVPELKGVVRNALQDVNLMWATFDKK